MRLRLNNCSRAGVILLEIFLGVYNTLLGWEPHDVSINTCTIHQHSTNKTWRAGAMGAFGARNKYTCVKRAGIKCAVVSGAVFLIC